MKYKKNVLFLFSDQELGLFLLAQKGKTLYITIETAAIYTSFNKDAEHKAHVWQGFK